MATKLYRMGEEFGRKRKEEEGRRGGGGGNKERYKHKK